MTDPALTITVLGSGTSHGIPMIACDCPVCTSADPRDKRTRPSIAVTYETAPATTSAPHRPAADAPPIPNLQSPIPNLQSPVVNPQSSIETTLLIDTAPELRLQCLADDIRRVDAVLYTHHHIDHLAGLDDLRRFNDLQGQILPCYGQTETLERLRTMFAYAFEHDPEYPSAKPRLTLQAIDGPFEIGGRTITPIPLMHGTLPVLGFRVGNFAYCTDVSEIPPAAWPLLEDLDVLILDALRKRPHPTHFNLDQAVEHAHRIGAKRTYFTHIAHELAHEETNRRLPPAMALSHDGQVIRST